MPPFAAHPSDAPPARCAERIEAGAWRRVTLPGATRRRRPLPRLGAIAVFCAAAGQSCAQAASAGAADDAIAAEPAARGAAFETALRERLVASMRVSSGGTQYLAGVQLQVDAIAARRRQDGGEQDTMLVSATPFGDAPGVQRLSARASQLEWISRTPTAAGIPVWTRLQANLFGPDGTTRPQLTQGWVRVGDTLLVGKTYSTFMDDSVLPATLDYNGPSGVSFVRQWLVRASVPLGASASADLSVEEAGVGDDPLPGLRTAAARPDLAARVRLGGDGAHLQIAGLSRRIDVEAGGTQAGGPPLGASGRAAGRGVSVSGSLATFGDDVLSGQWVRGEGIARYFNDAVSASGVAIVPGAGLSLATLTGATLYYRRAWASGLSSTFGGSRLWIEEAGLRAPTALRALSYASANLVWRLSPTVFAGVELTWGEAASERAGRAGTVRAQASLRWLAF
jgi:hypothetical protein